MYSTAGLPSCLAPAGRHVSDENQKLMGGWRCSLSESRMTRITQINADFGVSRFNIFGKMLLISFFVGVGLVPTLRPYGTKARGCETFLAPAGRHVYSTAGLPSCLAPAGRHVSHENQKLMGGWRCSLSESRMTRITQINAGKSRGTLKIRVYPCTP